MTWVFDLLFTTIYVQFWAQLPVWFMLAFFLTFYAQSRCHFVSNTEQIAYRMTAKPSILTRSSCSKNCLKSWKNFGKFSKKLYLRQNWVSNTPEYMYGKQVTLPKKSIGKWKGEDFPSPLILIIMNIHLEYKLYNLNFKNNFQNQSWSEWMTLE